MKKITIAIAIAAIIGFTCTTQAATIYDKDGLTYELNGELQIQYRQEPGIDKNLDVEFDTLELYNTISYVLSNDFTAIGALNFCFEGAADDDAEDAPSLDEAYLGFQYKPIEFIYGKAYSAADDFGIIGTIATTHVDEAFELAGAEHGDDLSKLSASFGPVSFIVAHELESEGESSENGQFTDVLVTAELYGASVGAAYQTYQAAGSDDTVTIWGVSAGYDFKYAAIAADYSLASNEDDTEGSVMNICLTVPVQSVTLGAGYQMINDDDTVFYADDEFTSYYANATYVFPSQSNVSIFAEIAGTDIDDDEDWDMGYLIGTNITF